jgi:hypothetical protein
VCLFAPLSVTQLLFSSFSSAAGIANFIVFNMTENPNGRIDPTVRFFLSCDTPAECHEATVSKHSFGLGGSCVPEPFALSFQTNTKLCKSPEAAGTVNATKWAAYTGRGDVQRLGQLAAHLGNSTFHHWNRPVSIEGAHGSLNFRPLLTRDDTLTLWEDAMMRPIDMRYVRDTSVLDIATLRFQPDDLVFSGADPVYNYAGIPIPRGLLNVSSAGPIRWVYFSTLFRAHCLQRITHTYILNSHSHRADTAMQVWHARVRVCLAALFRGRRPASRRRSDLPQLPVGGRARRGRRRRVAAAH